MGHIFGLELAKQINFTGSNNKFNFGSSTCYKIIQGILLLSNKIYNNYIKLNLYKIYNICIKFNKYLFTDSIRCYPNQSTAEEKTIRQHVMNWFHHSSDRGGGREERRKKKVVNDAS